MEIKCKNGCEDPGWFNVIAPLGVAVRPDGSFIDEHLIVLGLNNEDLEKTLECPKCDGPVSVTSD